jgi:hypothetical protein
MRLPMLSRARCRPGRPRGIAGSIAVAVTLAGCGLQTAPTTGGAKLTLTRDFGATAIGGRAQASIPGGETLTAMLRRMYGVRTDRRGAVAAIGGTAASSGLVWNVWVNGIAPATKPAKTKVNHGDHVWWDLHSSAATASVPAVVGAYPEPFTTGSGGRRLPTLLACAPDVRGACATVSHALQRVGVKAPDQVIGTYSGSNSLTVIVGSFRDLRGVIALELIQAGPAESGVYARFGGRDGSALELDDPAGQVSQTLTGDVGLIAATEQPGLDEPAWLVTGTDSAGVAAAARALTPAALHDRLAIAVAGGRELPLPRG